MLIYSYINTRGNWKNSKLCENTPPFGRRVSTQFLVFPISTRVDITVYQHGKCFIFLKYNIASGYSSDRKKYFPRSLIIKPVTINNEINFNVLEASLRWRSGEGARLTRGCFRLESHTIFSRVKFLSLRFFS